ncbi:hypothetical protein [Neopusillimonas aestuarii]
MVSTVKNKVYIRNLFMSVMITGYFLYQAK